MVDSPLHDQIDSPYGIRPQRCPGCGIPVDDQWVYCDECGARQESATRLVATGAAPGDVHEPAAEPDSKSYALLGETPPARKPDPVAKTRDTPSHPRRRRAMYVTGLVALIAVAMIGWALNYIASADLDRAQGTLSETRSNLATSQGALSDTRMGLTTTGVRLELANVSLTDTRADLRRARADLADAHGSLSTAENRLDLQANQIQTLKSCLNGVSRALGYVAYSQYGAALSALGAVEVACEKARSIL